MDVCSVCVDGQGVSVCVWMGKVWVGRCDCRVGEWMSVCVRGWCVNGCGE